VSRFRFDRLTKHSTPRAVSQSPIVLDLSTCPECASPAEILGRWVVESTDGPIEEIRLRCLRRHVFLLPSSYLERN